MDLREKGMNCSDLNYCPTSDIDQLFGGQPANAVLMIRLHSLLDPSQAPEGKGTVGIVACLPYDYGQDWNPGKECEKGEEYEALKERVGERLVSSAERVIPGLSQSVVYKRIATPITLEEATGNSFGSGMGWYPEPGGKMRSQKTPIRNLYQAGHWTFPGGSVPAVMASGRNAAQLVLKAEGMA